MRPTSLVYLAVLLLPWVLAGCATSPGTAERKAEPPPEEVEAAGPPLPAGALEIDITNVLGQHLDARVDLLGLAGAPEQTLEVAGGRLETRVPQGAYRAYVHVYDYGVPVLVETRDLEVGAEKPAYLLVNLLEGASGALTVRDFDFDGDLAIDRVELDSGTNPEVVF